MITRHSVSAQVTSGYWDPQTIVTTVFTEDFSTVALGAEMVPNGTFDTNTTGWTAMSNTTIARVTTPVADGAGALRLTRTTSTGTAGATTPTGTSGIPVVAGRTYVITHKHRTASVSQTTGLMVRWYSAAGASVGTRSTNYSDSTTYQSRTLTVPAPSGGTPAAFMALEYTATNAAVNEIHYLDTVSVKEVNANGWVAGETGVSLEPSGGSLRVERPSYEGTTATISKAVTGLTIGRQYTVTATIREASSGRVDSASIGISGIGNGATADPTTSDSTVTYTFTATATSHTIVLTATDASGPLALWDNVVMTYSEDVVVWVANPPIPLSVIQAEVGMDEGWSPYVQARLICWTPPQEVLDLVNPTDGVRVEVTVTQDWGTESAPYGSTYSPPVSRTFDLALRERTVDYETGTMDLILESDEALALDYCLVADEPLVLGVTDVATIVNTCLALIGAELEP